MHYYNDRYPDYLADWHNCTICPLHKHRRNVVFQRSGKHFVSRNNWQNTQNHPHIIFIGEAPGEAEDHTGRPFVGRSGGMLHRTFKLIDLPFKYTLTNVVGCWPHTPGTPNTHPPEKDSVKACKPRLKLTIEHHQPDGVVLVGAVAGKVSTRLPTAQIVHPAYILRQEYCLYLMKKQALKIQNLLQDLQNESW